MGAKQETQMRNDVEMIEEESEVESIEEVIVEKIKPKKSNKTKTIKKK